jgi:hypothetical protein
MMRDRACSRDPSSDLEVPCSGSAERCGENLGTREPVSEKPENESRIEAAGYRDDMWSSVRIEQEVNGSLQDP